MKKGLLTCTYLLITCVLMACHTDVPPSCNVSKPLDELPWLQSIVADAIANENQSTSIYQTSYKNRTVYLVSITPGPDRGVQTLYDCQGTALCKGYTTIAGFHSDCQHVFDEAKTEILLFQR